jgi:transcriptional regulator with XRE-family HTH domain
MTAGEFKEWRRRLGLSQEHAAEALGLSRNTIARYEAGHTPQIVDLACEHLESKLRQAVDKKALLMRGGDPMRLRQT